MNVPPIVTAFIPSKNRLDSVMSLIEDLRRQDYPQEKLNIIVIDDGSSPAYDLQALDVQVIRHDVSCGAQASRNEGIEQARSEFLFLLDDDIELLGNDFLTRSVNVLQNSPNVAAVFGKKYDVHVGETNPIEHEYSVSRPAIYSGDLIPVKSNGGPIDWGCMICLARRSVIVNCGGLDGIYGLNGGHSFREESDLQARIRAKGHILWYLPEIAFRHKIIDSGGHGPAVGKRLYWIAHNHMIFLKRHLRLWPLRAMGFLVDVFRYSWVQGHLRHTLSMLRGYLAGWRNALRDKGPGQNPWLEQP